MKIKELKVFNSVKCGSKEQLFLKSNEYDMELIEGSTLIKITDKEGNKVYTSLANSPWFTELEDSAKPVKKNNESKKSGINTKRTSKKAGKQAKVV